MKVTREGPLRIVIEQDEIADFLAIVSLSHYILNDCMRNETTPARLLNRSIGCGVCSMREVATAVDLARRIQEAI